MDETSESADSADESLGEGNLQDVVGGAVIDTSMMSLQAQQGLVNATMPHQQSFERLTSGLKPTPMPAEFNPVAQALRVQNQ